MLSFECDYNVGAHPKILEALVNSNMEPCPGYGNDKYTEIAREKIRAAVGREGADVRFLTGGTQTNRIVIDSMLKNYEGVIAATTGHISAHEAGAIEASGHKVLTVPGYDGKLKAADVEVLISSFYADGAHEHMVSPEWSTSRIRPNMARYTPKQSLRRYTRYAADMTFRFLSTARGLDTDL